MKESSYTERAVEPVILTSLLFEMEAISLVSVGFVSVKCMT